MYKIKNTELDLESRIFHLHKIFYSAVNSYTKTVWQELITAHLCKANALVNDAFTMPTSLISQETIFSKQLEKHICHKCPEVAVLSAFPLYVLDYFGCERTITKLNS